MDKVFIVFHDSVLSRVFEDYESSLVYCEQKKYLFGREHLRIEVHKVYGDKDLPKL